MNLAPWITPSATEEWSSSSGTGVSWNFGTYAALEDYDVVLICVGALNTTDTFNAPTGMTKISQATDGDVTRAYFWYRYGVDTPGDITNSTSDLDRWSYTIVIRGAVRSGTPFDTYSWSTYTTGTTHTIPSITSSGPERLNVFAHTCNVDAFADDGDTHAYSLGAPEEWKTFAYPSSPTYYIDACRWQRQQVVGASDTDTLSAGSGACQARGIVLNFIPDDNSYGVRLYDSAIGKGTTNPSDYGIQYPSRYRIEDGIVGVTLLTHDYSGIVISNFGDWTLLGGPFTLDGYTAWFAWRRSDGTEDYGEHWTVTDNWGSNSNSRTWGLMRCPPTGDPWDDTNAILTSADDIVEIPSIYADDASIRYAFAFWISTPGADCLDDAYDYVEVQPGIDYSAISYVTMGTTWESTDELWDDCMVDDTVEAACLSLMVLHDDTEPGATGASLAKFIGAATGDISKAIDVAIASIGKIIGIE